MNTPDKIIWIDDNPSRAPTAIELGAEFINVHQQDISTVVETLLVGTSPRLVVMDHVLDKAAGTVHPVFKKGSTIAEAIKERWPHCPVVGVTNADNITGIDARTKGIYDSLFPFSEFGKYFDRINGIAAGFAEVAAEGNEIGCQINLLKPPTDDSRRLNDALDTDLKNARDASLPSRMYRWVERLMDRPGFLLDSLWSATLLGITKEGFDLVADKFAKAAYTGIFSRPDEPRWWATTLAELLYKECPANAGELTWHVGRRLPDITDRHFSACYYCKKSYPEIVAFLDEASADQHAMHLGCTILHPRFSRELYFEDIRMMCGE